MRAHSIVINNGVIALADDVRTRVHEYIPAGLLTDAGALLHWCGTQFPQLPAAGTLIVPTVPAFIDGDDRYGLAPRARLMTERAAAAGWERNGGQDWERGGWITWTHNGTGQVIYMGILDLMDQDRTPAFRLGSSARDIADALAAYVDATGMNWRMTAGVTGCAMVKTTIHRVETNKMIRRGPDKPVPAPRWHSTAATTYGVHAAGDLRYNRMLAPAERQYSRLYQLDVRAAYLAAAAAVDLPWSELRPVDRQVFTGQAGYWQVDLNDLVDGAAAVSSATLPHLGPALWNPDAADDAGLMWLTTPVMGFLSELGINPVVRNALLAPSQSRFLRPWAESIRDALANPTATAEVRTALKRTYSETVGMFAAAGGSIHRPEWRDLIVDTARVSVLRKVFQARRTLGIWPARIYVDAVWYPYPDDAPADDLVHALGGTGRIGKFRHVKSTSVDTWIEG